MAELRPRYADYVVPEHASLQEAMRCIDRSEYGTVALVVSGRHLRGLVTNGDIRRAILRGSDLSRPVSEVMNQSPIVIREAELHQPGKVAEAVQRLQDIGGTALQALPVVGDDGGLHDLIIGPELYTLLSRVLHTSDPVRFTRPRVLLVGGAGYIGTVLSQQLLKDGSAVRVADRLLYGADSIASLRDQPHYEFFRCDFRHIENMIDLVADVDAVVYLAEIVGDPACALAPELALETNFISAVAFATLCDHLQVNRFVYLSSCSVYGAAPDGDAFLDESSPLNPVSIYAQMKIKTERGLLELPGRSSNFSPTILRLATVFGLSPRPRFDLVVNRMTAQAMRQGSIKIFGGDQWRPNVHVGDVARAIVAVLNAPLDKVSGAILNVGDNRLNLRVREIGHAVASEIPGTRVDHDRAAVDARDYRVSFDRIRSLLGFEATRTVEQGVGELRDFLRANPIDIQAPRYNNS